MHPWLAEIDVRRGRLLTKVVFQRVLLEQISIAETTDRKDH